MKNKIMRSAKTSKFLWDIGIYCPNDPDHSFRRNHQKKIFWCYSCQEHFNYPFYLRRKGSLPSGWMNKEWKINNNIYLDLDNGKKEQLK